MHSVVPGQKWEGFQGKNVERNQEENLKNDSMEILGGGVFFLIKAKTQKSFQFCKMKEISVYPWIILKFIWKKVSYRDL